MKKLDGMNNYKVMLLGSYDFTAEVENYRFNLPYGIGILAGFLKEKSVDVTLEDLSLKIERYNRNTRFLSKKIKLHVFDDNKRVIRYVYKGVKDKELYAESQKLINLVDFQGFQLIGVSVRSYFQMLMALVLVKELKKISDFKVVLGGAFITLFGEYYFSKSHFIDYMIKGDGQLPLLRLIESLQSKIPLQSVPNLIYRKKGKIKENKRESYPVEELNIPDYSGLPIDFYRTYPYGVLYFPYRIGKGCVHRCSFCTYRKLEPVVGQASLEKTISEIKQIKDNYPNICLQLVATSINASYEYMNDLSDALINNGIEVIWSVNARLDNLDKPILAKMKKAGCLALEFGLESGSKGLLTKMNKDVNLQKASQILKDSWEAGIKNVINVMIGHPGESYNDILLTARFIEKNARYIYAIPFYGYVMTAGSPIYEHPEEFGVTNIRSSSGEFDTEFLYCAFDEKEGMCWAEKKEATERFKKLLLKANFKYILKNNYPFLKFVPFFIYSFWRRIIGVRN